LRKVMLAGALALGACTPRVETIVVPVETPAPAKALSVRPGMQRLMTVETLYAWCEGGRLMIVVDGMTNSGGWTGGSLNPLPTADGRRTFEAVAVPPRGPASTALQPMRIAHEEIPSYWLSRVRVLSQTNQLESEIQLGPC
jgi:hypothetical protein